ncbi:immunoglobulin E-set, partial [Mycena rebaudengoi]
MSSGSRHSIGLRNICGLEDSDISATTRRRRADTLPNHASGNQCEAEALSSSSTMQGSLNAELVNSQELPFPDASLGRHGTLLSHNATPVRRTAELRSLLGNANSRLRSRAIISQHSQGRGTTSLEQAKPRARVEIDIVLHNNVCIEGGYMKGQIKLRIRPRSKKESAVKISDGKLRLIGFESIEGDHHEFFQVSAPLSTVTNSAHIMYNSPPDEEGFYAAREGVHKLDFEMHIPMNSDKRPKGPLHGQSGGIAIRYIALASIKVKDDVHCRSIAHFYRDCEVWPRLNPSVVLAPAEHPIQAAAAKSLFMGGSGNVKLTASLHRSIFIAGQQCPINVAVQNDSKRLIKSLTLTLFRTTVVFKPQLAASHDTAMPNLDACQTCTTRKQVAVSTLEMAQGFPRGHASANGWWAGIPSGERSSFSHLLLIPPDALTHSRKRLLEVQYSIRVSVHAGSLTTDVYVTLPIQVVNFLSLDPPPSYPLL